MPRSRVLAALTLTPAFMLVGAACAPPDDGDAIDDPTADPSSIEPAPEPTEITPAIEAVAAVTPAPDTVRIVRVNAIGGTGCPQGSVNGSISLDQTTLLLNYSKFTATRGPNVPAVRSRVACTVSLTLFIPQGFTFTINQIDNRGSVDIPRGMTAVQRSTYRVQGQTGEAVPNRTQFTGPTRRTFVASNVYPEERLVFSRCGQETTLNVVTSVQLSGTTAARGTIAIDGLNQSFIQRYRMGWRRCN